VQVVSDQIRLWQADLMRVGQQQAVLYDDFPSAEVFQKSCAFARSHGVWLWQDAAGGSQRRLVVRKDGHEPMRAYIRSIK
jgi:Transcription factor Tfb2 (p52) C-terminal domain